MDLGEHYLGFCLNDKTANSVESLADGKAMLFAVSCLGRQKKVEGNGEKRGRREWQNWGRNGIEDGKNRSRKREEWNKKKGKIKENRLVI